MFINIGKGTLFLLPGADMVSQFYQYLYLLMPSSHSIKCRTNALRREHPARLFKHVVVGRSIETAYNYRMNVLVHIFVVSRFWMYQSHSTNTQCGHL